MSDIRINMCGQLMTLTKLRDELEENNESSVFIDYMESFFRHIEHQHEQIKKLQSQNNTQTESINGLLKKVKRYEDALNEIHKIYKHGGTAFRIAKKALDIN